MKGLMETTEISLGGMAHCKRRYFRTMGIPVLKGRTFDQHDAIGKPWRVIISKRLADTLWPGEDPVGHQALLWKGQNGSAAEVVGVVGDQRERGLEADPTLTSICLRTARDLDGAVCRSHGGKSTA